MSLFGKNELRLLWPFYADAFLGTILFILNPFLMIYLMGIGLSLTQIGVLLAIWPLSSMLCEIPTGVIADKYGRKKSVMIGWFLQGLFLLLVPISNNYNYLLLLFVLEGASTSLVSGAYDSWVVDLLKSEKLKKYYSHYFTKRQSLINIALALSGLLGVLIVKNMGINWIWIFSGAALMITDTFLIFGKEKKFEKEKVHSIKRMYKHTWESFKEILRNRILLTLIIASLFMTLIGLFNGTTTWTPLLKLQGLKEYQFGYLWTIGSIIGAIAPFISQKMSKNNKEKGTLIKITLFFMIVALIAKFSNTLITSLVLATLSITLFDFKRPVWLSYFHHNVPSKKRATISSIEALISALGGSIALIIIGISLDHFGSQNTIAISAIFGLAALLTYLNINKKNA